jgi:hypothetical protein
MLRESVSLAQLEERAALALRHAMDLAGPHDSRLTIARKVYEIEMELSRQLAPHLVIARYVVILNRIWKDSGAKDQLRLPIPGLTIPPTIATGEKSRKRIALRDATLPELLQYRKELAVRRDKRIEERIAQLDKLIAYMRKHTKSKKATLGELVEKYGQLSFADIR